ncbi:DUF222 domain-containing protein [Blastococcus sp. SYSU D00669]
MTTPAATTVFAPQTDLASGPLAAVQEADREIARQVALRSRAMAEFAGTWPAELDRPQGVPGAMSAERWRSRPELLGPVSEWAVPELSIGLARAQGKAERLLDEALTLVHRLPGTLAALEAGMLTEDHLWCLREHVAPIADDAVRTEVEAAGLGWVAARAAGRTITTPPQLGAKVLREVTARNVRRVADELARAVKRRGVSVQGDRRPGMASVVALLTLPEAQALIAAAEAHVDALPVDPADTRTRGEKLADVLLDLVLRPGAGDRPPVQVTLTLVAPIGTVLGGDAPAELGGQVIPAELARQLLAALTGAHLGAAAGTAAPTEQAESAGWDEDDRFVDPGLDPQDWTEQMRAAHEAWEADWERRLDAGEFDGPDPLSAAEVVAAAERALDDGWLELEAELAATDAREEAEFAAGLHPDPFPEPEDGPPDDPPDSGWWAAADRAVEDASAAVRGSLRAMARAHRLVRTAERADLADEAFRRAGPSGRVSAARDALGALSAAAAADRAALTDLLARTAGGGLVDRPRIALVDALSGALVSLTDLPGLRRAATTGHPLGAPPPTDGYRPGAELDRFVRHRDRRCRFPGCRRRVRAGELDHHVPYPLGATSTANLVGFCTGDHRGKHQAPGTTHELAADGTLTVTTRSGLVATTEPPPF